MSGHWMLQRPQLHDHAAQNSTMVCMSEILEATHDQAGLWRDADGLCSPQPQGRHPRILKPDHWLVLWVVPHHCHLELLQDDGRKTPWSFWEFLLDQMSILLHQGAPQAHGNQSWSARNMESQHSLLRIDRLRFTHVHNHGFHRNHAALVQRIYLREFRHSQFLPHNVHWRSLSLLLLGRISNTSHRFWAGWHTHACSLLSRSQRKAAILSQRRIWDFFYSSQDPACLTPTAATRHWHNMSSAWKSKALRRTQSISIK